MAAASKSTDLVLSGKTVGLMVKVPKTPLRPERVVEVQVPVEVAEAYPAVGRVEEIAELTAEVFGNAGGTGLGVGDLTRIKVPSGESIAFTVGEDAQKTFSGVIILMQNRMNYWEKPPEESGGAKAPDCFSRDAKVGSGRYGKGSPENPSGLCEHCPMSKWTVGEDGETRIPSPCKPQVAVLIMMEGKPFPVMLTVPRTSMRALQDYWKRTLFMNMKSYAQVKTNFGLAKDKNAAGVAFNRITFEEGANLGKETKMVMLSLGEQYRGILANLDTSLDTEPPVDTPSQDTAADNGGGFDVVDDEPPGDGWDPADTEDAYAGAPA